MAARTVTDTDGRTWKCVAAPGVAGESSQGRDVMLSCETSSVAKPVEISVGWQWEKMADQGLARIVMLASPIPRGW